MKQHTQHLCAALFIVAVAATAGGLLLNSEADVLYRAQEMSLFVPGRHFFDTLNVYPGGLLTWMASWCTQFFYHPATGVTMLAALWALTMAMMCRVARMKGLWVGLAALLPLLLLTGIVQTGYWVYYMKLPGHLFVPTLGCAISVLAAFIGTFLPTTRIHGEPYRWSGIWMIIFALIGYPMLGAWSFVGVGLMALPWRVDGEEQRVPYVYQAINIVIAGVLIWWVPQMWQNHYEQTQIDQIYRAAMPCYQYGSVDHPEYHWYIYLIPACLTLICACQWIPAKWRNSRNLTAVLVVAALGATGWYANSRWYRDGNFHKEIRMNRCIEENNWEGVLDIARDGSDTIPPTRVMVMYKNLACFRLGRAGDEMFHYREGARVQNAPWPVKITQVGGKQIYYQYGKENFCYRWCMEDGVEFGWRVDVLRMMAKASIINHDYEVARKYLNILKKTRFHREWAESYEPFLHHPELVAADPNLGPITKLSTFTDRLDGDNTLIELYLLNSFANGHGADAEYQEMTLICAMLVKDIDLFWPRFFEYAQFHQKEPNFHMPKHYQEAAYLYSKLENKVDVSGLPFDEDVKENYEKFMAFNSQVNYGVKQQVEMRYQPMITNARTQEEKDRLAAEMDSTHTAELAKLFRPQFGDTFYYFYFLMRNQKTN